LLHALVRPDVDADTLLTVANNPATELRTLNAVIKHPNANAQVLAAVVAHIAMLMRPHY